MNITSLSIKEFNARNLRVWQEYYRTPVGVLHCAVTELGIYKAEFVDGCDDRAIIDRETRLLLVGTDFQVSVWKALLTIPEKQTTYYADIAQRVNRPRAWRAVANAIGQNPVIYFVPCHRVIHKDGTLSGYRGGVEKKSHLLAYEKNI